MILRDKGQALLRFLKDAATLRRRRIAAYGPGDRLLWFSDIPKGREECCTPLLSSEHSNDDETWLVVRKTQQPVRAPLPEAFADWVRSEDLDLPAAEPEILEQINVLVEKEVPDPDSPANEPRTIIQKVPKVRRRQDYPDVQVAWLNYLSGEWRPWAEAMGRWQEVYQVYAKVDEMRRRLAEAEERYELFLGLGLLQWRDGKGTVIRRHLLAGPAEIALDAARGILPIGRALSTKPRGADGFARWRLDWLNGMRNRLGKHSMYVWMGFIRYSPMATLTGA